MRISLPNVNKFSPVKAKVQKDGYSLLTIRVNIRIYDRESLNKILVFRNNDLFLDLLEDIRISNPDLITLQGIERGNENGISIEGYESVYFCPFDRDLGYATF